MYNIDTANINDMTNAQLKSYISSCETSFNSALEYIADEISKRPSIKLCGLAGPSCSGKTTGSFKLTVHLVKQNMWVRTLSIDDFFKNRAHGPIGDDGNPDYESLDFINLDLLQTTLRNILCGKTVYLPKYDFKSGIRTDKYEKYTPSENEIILIEGLHALNDIMYSDISHDEYYRLFINVASDIYLNSCPLFSGREVRIFRRLIRDYKFRASTAENTFDLWENVGLGEVKYIYPFEQNADFKLNSLFEYEPCVMKRQALEILSHIKFSSSHYAYARDLYERLEKVPTIDEKLVPADSLLQEFLGGDYFKYD